MPSPAGFLAFLLTQEVTVKDKKKKAPAKTASKKPKVKAAAKHPADSIPKGKLQDFPIDMLKFEPELQPRKGDATSPIGGLFAYHVNDLREAIKHKEPLPPVQVWIVAGRGNLVTDGHHTTEAYRQEGKKTVPAEVREGTWLDAVAAASQANSQHKALKRTNEDKRQAVRNLLTALREAKVAWSNSRVAKWCSVGDDLVAAMLLRQPPPSETKVEGGEEVKKLGVDGRAYKGSAGKKKTKRKGTTAEPAEEPVIALAVVTPPVPQGVFDFHAFESHAGVVMRDIDALAKVYSVLNTPRTEGMRRLYREFHQEFTQWHKELASQAAGERKGKP